MLRLKILIGSLAGVCVIVTVALIMMLLKNAELPDRDETILYQFDRTDLARLNEMVQRHQDGSGGYLLLIPPVVDGGYWIHDVHSNGSEITWTIDNTRDGMSSDQGKQEFQCQNIRFTETSEHYMYILNGCENQPEKDLPVFILRKDEIEG
ncbi:DUF4362 domain-containing protein [Paenibacillus soyae]|uniref:DUF4362 domain-containing protein n=1 Tax=Paenibacillus soyae TaxID=2969249 RepID=A0A9X2SB49_9BACL|nr:DUF4362 domain-containing protein [Paenibacillus soyae]MCR2806931.1 DUF4362 domain-containing protein [Paenibacillus soyae]